MDHLGRHATKLRLLGGGNILFHRQCRLPLVLLLMQSGHRVVSEDEFFDILRSGQNWHGLVTCLEPKPGGHGKPVADSRRRGRFPMQNMVPTEDPGYFHGRRPAKGTAPCRYSPRRLRLVTGRSVFNKVGTVWRSRTLRSRLRKQPVFHTSMAPSVRSWGDGRYGSCH